MSTRIHLALLDEGKFVETKDGIYDLVIDPFQLAGRLPTEEETGAWWMRPLTLVADTAWELRNFLLWLALLEDTAAVPKVEDFWLIWVRKKKLKEHQTLLQLLATLDEMEYPPTTTPKEERKMKQALARAFPELQDKAKGE